MAGGIKQSFDDDDMQENHEINVTPFIDVMLVLLIIFMVAAPLATVDINVDLPASTARPAPKPEEPLYVTLKDDLSLAIGQQTVDRSAFQQQLDTIAKGDKQKRIFLRADRGVAYGELMEVMNLMRGVGYLKVALVGLETVPTTTPAAGAAQ
ncbi:MAG: TonB system transport protein ExbD [Aquamicrobium sp.]|uniref:TonB system transport protein ExbD n=1 Tax=Mesorhizobium sp. Pch-S TaxID=2082387 RepID=UPI001012EC00|nr:TonB system transport protein ExbD [Mesorhizobium sp. Pch-S]MBR2686559.1 TonB system transport protein ExbD [Aquamicrobium sp.]QAZ42198.1 TonB system transport protein ExbD [Mesorhizobium sp. Pch-S]